MKKQLGNREQETGLMLVPRRVRQAEEGQVIREGSTGRVVARVSNALNLPRVWAVAERVAAIEPELTAEESGEAKVELAFYRKYTEGMLRRYLRLSMQAAQRSCLL